MNDIPQRIFNFVSSIPKTIMLDQLIFIVLYATGKYSTVTELFDSASPDEIKSKLLQELQDYLHQPDSIAKVGATLCVVGVIDHVISRSSKKIKSAGPMLKQIVLKYPKFESISAQHPLRQRHTEKVLADWIALRSTTITAQTLQDFEDMCLDPRRPR
jgi:hypothetical protein